jgi:hypothetical protein
LAIAPLEFRAEHEITLLVPLNHYRKPIILHGPLQPSVPFDYSIEGGFFKEGSEAYFLEFVEKGDVGSKTTYRALVEKIVGRVR